MQTFILPSQQAYLDTFDLYLTITSQQVSGSQFGPVNYQKPDDYLIVAEGDFNLVNNDTCVVIAEQRQYYPDGGYSQVDIRLSGSVIEVSPNNFELQ
jgi:hypothetical protein